MALRLSDFICSCGDLRTQCDGETNLSFCFGCPLRSCVSERQQSCSGQGEVCVVLLYRSVRSSLLKSRRVVDDVASLAILGLPPASSTGPCANVQKSWTSHMRKCRASGCLCLGSRTHCRHCPPPHPKPQFPCFRREIRVDQGKKNGQAHHSRHKHAWMPEDAADGPPCCCPRRHLGGLSARVRSAASPLASSRHSRNFQFFKRLITGLISCVTGVFDV